ncbi:MAG TPA: NAD(P)/FAD-dependent oxidoreductase [Thermoanaerobaculia bacterium]|nr:NAD(P)/FAD-dependent oxidoreductase [Thermoanaerobaculia bacterium]
MRTCDAVVVGAGPNGLAAAITLAREGLSVVLLEANATIGGATRSVASTLPGFLHDHCSAFHPMALASPFFRSLPLAEHGLEWRNPPAALAHPLDDGSAVMLERSIDATAAALGDDGPAWRALMGPFVERADALFDAILRPIGLPLRSPLLLGRFGLRALRSARGVSRRFRGGRARALFAGIAGHSMIPLESAGSGAFALALGVAGHAVGWPVARGGSQSIADALASCLLSLGGEIVTGVRVASMRELPAARAVIFDLTPRQLAAIAGSELPASYVARLGRYRYGPGVFKVDWALDGPIPWRSPECLRAGTVHVGGAFDEIAAYERAVWRGSVSEPPFVLVGQQSLFDDTRAPAGKQTAWAYCHVPHGSADDMTAAIERQIERFAPHFRDRILARTTAGPQQLEIDNANLVGGDIAGGATDLAQVLMRPVASVDPYATPNPKIFIGSSATPPGAGVHGMCGHLAARSALRRCFGRRGRRGVSATRSGAAETDPSASLLR